MLPLSQNRKGGELVSSLQAMRWWEQYGLLEGSGPLGKLHARVGNVRGAVKLFF